MTPQRDESHRWRKPSACPSWTGSWAQQWRYMCRRSRCPRRAWWCAGCPRCIPEYCWETCQSRPASAEGWGHRKSGGSDCGSRMRGGSVIPSGPGYSQRMLPPGGHRAVTLQTWHSAEGDRWPHSDRRPWQSAESYQCQPARWRRTFGSGSQSKGALCVLIHGWPAS